MIKLDKKSGQACLEAVQGLGCGDGNLQLIPKSNSCWKEGVSVQVCATEWDQEAYIPPSL